MAKDFQSPQIRLPPLSGFNKFTIQCLYSPVVEDVTRKHPEIVNWIGQSAIAMIESLATKEYTLEDELGKEVADLKLRFEIMKTKLNEERTRQLHEEALKELITMKREMSALSQTSCIGVKEQSIRTTSPFSGLAFLKTWHIAQLNSRKSNLRDAKDFRTINLKTTVTVMQKGPKGIELEEIENKS